MSKPSPSSRYPRPPPPGDPFHPPFRPPDNGFRRGPPPPYNGFRRGPPPPLRYHHHRNNYYDNSSHHLRRDRPNFVIELLCDRPNATHYKRDIDALIKKLNSAPENYEVYWAGLVAAALVFRQWVHALEAVVGLWSLRLEGDHEFTPRLVSNVLVPSDQDEMNLRLSALFCEHIKRLIDWDGVKGCVERVENLDRDIRRVSNLLKGRNSVAVFGRLDEEKRGLVKEKKLVERRIEEFRSAMRCLVGDLEGEKVDEHDVRVFKIGGGFDWCRIYSLIDRECRRLEAGLPIYGFRKEILNRIYNEQVAVLVI